MCQLSKDLTQLAARIHEDPASVPLHQHQLLQRALDLKPLTYTQRQNLAEKVDKFLATTIHPTTHNTTSNIIFALEALGHLPAPEIPASVLSN